jgi:hypothetical protein
MSKILTTANFEAYRSIPKLKFYRFFSQSLRHSMNIRLDSIVIADVPRRFNFFDDPKFPAGLQQENAAAVRYNKGIVIAYVDVEFIARPPLTIFV